MNGSWALRLLKGLLACSSAQWRARFEKQATADLEDAWEDLPVDHRLGWVFSVGLDLVQAPYARTCRHKRNPRRCWLSPVVGCMAPLP